MCFKTLACTLVVLALASAGPAFAKHNASEHIYHYDNVLGSSLEIRISAPAEQAVQAKDQLLGEIRRLESIFSSYDAASEVSQLNRGELSGRISAELLEMVELCEKWRSKMPKAFSCRMGDVISAWQRAFESQIRPKRKSIRTIARRALEAEVSMEAIANGKGSDAFSWNFGAIAKGYILDRAMSIARRAAPTASAIGIDIGGDATYWQVNQRDEPWQVKIAAPNNIDDGDSLHLGHLAMRRGAIAYSGHNSRGLTIGRRTYSHILVPRDGWPKQFSSAAIVTAPTATEADALATALATMEIPAALDWLGKQNNPDFAALLIGRDGRQHGTANWYSHMNLPGTAAAVEAREGSPSATIHFALPKPEGGRYRRPYVALWLEDSQRQVVRNLLLLGESESWMSKNSYWWRKQGRAEPDLLQGLARPTRRPGEYRLSWQGRDDFGRPLAAGKYKLHLEVAREHGDHERITIPFQWSGTATEKTRKGRLEIDYLRLQVENLSGEGGATSEITKIKTGAPAVGLSAPSNSSMTNHLTTTGAQHEIR